MPGKQFIKHRVIEKGSDYEKSVIDFYRSEAARSIQSITRIGHFSDSKLLLLNMDVPQKGDQGIQAVEKKISSLSIEERRGCQKKETILLLNEALCTLRIKANGKTIVKPIIRHEGNDAQYDLLAKMMSALEKHVLHAPSLRQSSIVRSLLSTTQKLMEPLDVASSQEIARSIKALRYEDLNFSLPEFTLHLFSALRANLITMNEMMTAKLMYESLESFKHSGFKRHVMGSSGSPYQPSNNIIIWGAKEDSALKNEEASNRLYYVFDLPRYMHAGFLYYYLENVTQYSDEEIEKLKLMLRAYFNFSQDQLGEEDLISAEEEIDGFSDKTITEDLRELIVNTKHGAEFFKKERFSRFDLSAKKEIDDIKFIAASGFDSMFPFFCFSTSDPTRLSMALPTVDAFNTLNRIAYQEEALLPIAAIGPGEATRSVRANDELPTLTALTETQILLKILYPTAATLKQAARNVEIPIEGIPCAKDPHKLSLSKFMLMAHDFFHVLNSSMQFKAYFRMLRLIHDEKGGFSESKSGMSKSLWILTDLPFDAIERRCLLLGRVRTFCLKRLELLKEVGFDFSIKNDNNYLLLHYEYHHVDQWASMFLGQPLQKVLQDVRDIEQFNPDMKGFLSHMREEKSKLAAYLSERSQASVVEFILQDLLDPATRNTGGAISFLVEHAQLEKIFTWTANDGLYFKKEVYEKNNLSAMGVNRKLRSTENTPQVLQSVVQKIAETYRVLLQSSPVSVVGLFGKTRPSPDCLSQRYDQRDNSSAPSGLTLPPRSPSPNQTYGSF